MNTGGVNNANQNKTIDVILRPGTYKNDTLKWPNMNPVLVKVDPTKPLVEELYLRLSENLQKDGSGYRNLENSKFMLEQKSRFIRNSNVLNLSSTCEDLNIVNNTNIFVQLGQSEVSIKEEYEKYIKNNNNVNINQNFQNISPSNNNVIMNTNNQNQFNFNMNMNNMNNMNNINNAQKQVSASVHGTAIGVKEGELILNNLVVGKPLIPQLYEKLELKKRSGDVGAQKAMTATSAVFVASQGELAENLYMQVPSEMGPNFTINFAEPSQDNHGKTIKEYYEAYQKLRKQWFETRKNTLRNIVNSKLKNVKNALIYDFNNKSNSAQSMEVLQFKQKDDTLREQILSKCVGYTDEQGIFHSFINLVSIDGIDGYVTVKLAFQNDGSPAFTKDEKLLYVVSPFQESQFVINQLHDKGFYYDQRLQPRYFTIENDTGSQQKISSDHMYDQFGNKLLPFRNGVNTMERDLEVDIKVNGANKFQYSKNGSGIQQLINDLGIKYTGGANVNPQQLCLQLNRRLVALSYELEQKMENAKDGNGKIKLENRNEIQKLQADIKFIKKNLDYYFEPTLADKQRLQKEADKSGANDKLKLIAKNFGKYNGMGYDGLNGYLPGYFDDKGKYHEGVFRFYIPKLRKFIKITESEMLDFEQQPLPNVADANEYDIAKNGQPPVLQSLNQSWLNTVNIQLKSNKMLTCLLKKIGDEIFDSSNKNNPSYLRSRTKNQNYPINDLKATNGKPHNQIKNDYQILLQDNDFLTTLAYADYIKACYDVRPLSSDNPRPIFPMFLRDAIDQTSFNLKNKNINNQKAAYMSADPEYRPFGLNTQNILASDYENYLAKLFLFENDASISNYNEIDNLLPNASCFYNVLGGCSESVSWARDADGNFTYSKQNDVLNGSSIKDKNSSFSQLDAANMFVIDNGDRGVKRYEYLPDKSANIIKYQTPASNICTFKGMNNNTYSQTFSNFTLPPFLIDEGDCLFEISSFKLRVQLGTYATVVYDKKKDAWTVYDGNNGHPYGWSFNDVMNLTLQRGCGIEGVQYQKITGGEEIKKTKEKWEKSLPIHKMYLPENVFDNIIRNELLPAVICEANIEASTITTGKEEKVVSNLVLDSNKRIRDYLPYYSDVFGECTIGELFNLTDSNRGIIVQAFWDYSSNNGNNIVLKEKLLRQEIEKLISAGVVNKNKRTDIIKKIRERQTKELKEFCSSVRGTNFDDATVSNNIPGAPAVTQMLGIMNQVAPSCFGTNARWSNVLCPDNNSLAQNLGFFPYSGNNYNSYDWYNMLLSKTLWINGMVLNKKEITKGKQTARDVMKLPFLTGNIQGEFLHGKPTLKLNKDFIVRDFKQLLKNSGVVGNNDTIDLKEDWESEEIEGNKTYDDLFGRKTFQCLPDPNLKIKPPLQQQQQEQNESEGEPSEEGEGSEESNEEEQEQEHGQGGLSLNPVGEGGEAEAEAEAEGFINNNYNQGYGSQNNSVNNNNNIIGSSQNASTHLNNSNNINASRGADSVQANNTVNADQRIPFSSNASRIINNNSLQPMSRNTTNNMSNNNFTNSFSPSSSSSRSSLGTVSSASASFIPTSTTRSSSSNVSNSTKGSVNDLVNKSNNTSNNSSSKNNNGNNTNNNNNQQNNVEKPSYAVNIAGAGLGIVTAGAGTLSLVGVLKLGGVTGYVLLGAGVVAIIVSGATGAYKSSEYNKKLTNLKSVNNNGKGMQK